MLLQSCVLVLKDTNLGGICVLMSLIVTALHNMSSIILLPCCEDDDGQKTPVIPMKKQLIISTAQYVYMYIYI